MGKVGRGCKDPILLRTVCICGGTSLSSDLSSSYVRNIQNIKYMESHSICSLFDLVSFT